MEICDRCHGIKNVQKIAIAYIDFQESDIQNSKIEYTKTVAICFNCLKELITEKPYLSDWMSEHTIKAKPFTMTVNIVCPVCDPDPEDTPYVIVWKHCSKHTRNLKKWN